MDRTTKARIDKIAVEALEQAESGYEFMVAINVRVRGMCPDGCCGGVGEVEHPTDSAIAIDTYAKRLIKRGFELKGY